MTRVIQLDQNDRELRDGKVTPDAAEAAYAVVVDRAALKVNREATAALRAHPSRHHPA
jgi:hypothetical protein